jgi:hypothetical protein
MTAYAASFTVNTGTVGTATLGITPGSFDVRLAQVSVAGEVLTTASGGNYGINYAASFYPSSVLSGGSTVTPVPLRSGAAAATTIAKSGATISGSSMVLREAYQKGGGGNAAAALNDAYTPPFDVILKAGATLWVTSSFSGSGGGDTTVTFYFEELHLARST